MSNKCRAKGGVENCTSPNCPEKRAQFQQALDAALAGGNVKEFAKQIKKVDWLDQDTILFKTLHGSKLYGTNHADSDDDFWIVRPTKHNGRKRNIKQTIVDNVDAVELDFATFVEMAAEGVPQALEAMFSERVLTSQIDHFREAFRATGSPVWDRYRRTIKKFALEGDVKHRRHALRLAYNLRQLMEQERFDPTLSPAQAKRFTDLAQQDDQAYRDAVQELSPIEIGFTDDSVSVTEH